MYTTEASLPRYCPLCSGDPDAAFELRFIDAPDIPLHVGCLHCSPAKVGIGIAPAYQDRKFTT